MQQYDSDMSGLVWGPAICDHAAWKQMIRGHMDMNAKRKMMCVCVCVSPQGGPHGGFNKLLVPKNDY